MGRMKASAETTRKDRIRDAIRIAVFFHLLILLTSSLGMDGGELSKIAAFALIPYWSMVALIVWKRREAATRVDYALIAYSYPVLFGAYFIWNGVAASVLGR